MDRQLVDGILDLAEAALLDDDLTNARLLYAEVLQADPENRIARIGIEEIEQNLRRTVPHDRPLRLKVGLPELLSRPLGCFESIVMSRITAGGRTVDELAADCAIPQVEVAQIVGRFLEQELVAVA